MYKILTLFITIGNTPHMEKDLMDVLKMFITTAK